MSYTCLFVYCWSPSVECTLYESRKVVFLDHPCIVDVQCPAEGLALSRHLDVWCKSSLSERILSPQQFYPIAYTYNHVLLFSFIESPFFFLFASLLPSLSFLLPYFIIHRRLWNYRDGRASGWMLNFKALNCRAAGKG